MSNELMNIDPNIMASLIIQGDISKLTAPQRVEYITKLCERVGVDPLTQPFKILRLQGREVLYADKGCAQQLCKVYKISTETTKKERVEDVWVVTTRAHMPDGRYTDEDGAVTIASMKGDALANALMKASTKSKRRAVLALCGLGLLDESELETIKGVEKVEKPEAEMPKLKAETAKEPAKEAPKAVEAEVVHQPAQAAPEPEKPVKVEPAPRFELSAKSVANLNKAMKFLGKDFKVILDKVGIPKAECITTDEQAEKVYKEAYAFYKATKKEKK